MPRKRKVGMERLMSRKRKAFVCSRTGMLKAHGFVDSNDPDDIEVEVPDDFDRQPNHTKYQNGHWIAATPVEAPDTPGRAVDVNIFKDRAQKVMADNSLPVALRDAFGALIKLVK